MKISNLFGSVTNPIEKFLQPPSLVFSLIVLYQGLFSGNAVVIPQRLKVLFGNKFFRLFSLFLITLTSSRDVEYALLSTVIFVTFIYALKTPEEREKTGLI
jgi:hypothetical protein|tara:strand:+ start:100 stop:402 length:303 start_codon:yes stop_codon:yes gene_type:complete